MVRPGKLCASACTSACVWYYLSPPPLFAPSLSLFPFCFSLPSFFPVYRSLCICLYLPFSFLLHRVCFFFFFASSSSFSFFVYCYVYSKHSRQCNVMCHPTGYDRHDTRFLSKRKRKNQGRKHSRKYADFRKFSARGGVKQRPKDMRCSNPLNKPDQLQQMITSTRTCGISTQTPFLGRAITTTAIHSYIARQ